MIKAFWLLFLIGLFTACSSKVRTNVKREEVKCHQLKDEEEKSRCKSASRLQERKPVRGLRWREIKYHVDPGRGLAEKIDEEIERMRRGEKLIQKFPEFKKYRRDIRKGSIYIGIPYQVFEAIVGQCILSLTKRDREERVEYICKNRDHYTYFLVKKYWDPKSKKVEGYVQGIEKLITK